MTHRSDIARWKECLKHVRFCEAAPRQGEDREIFEIDIEIPEAEPAFLELLSSLGIELRRIQPEDTVARAGNAFEPQPTPKRFNNSAIRWARWSLGISGRFESPESFFERRPENRQIRTALYQKDSHHRFHR